VDTKDLTTSFGWLGNQAFQQHDVQELLRKLFEALDVCLTRGTTAIKSKNKVASKTDSSAPQATDSSSNANTSDANANQSASKPPQDAFNYGNITANLVNELYEGTILDYIRCMECNYARERHDPFFDVPIAIRDVDSIESGLEKYLAPEILSEGNQWRCEQCGVPVDAFKGLQFAKLPYFLTLQLNRFDYDQETWRRIKLNNKVSFPLTLDMNPFFNDESPPSASDDKSVQPKPLRHQYELYSVMIHSGGAEGGHYYAFIKSFEKDKWFKFNDSSVTEISYEDICTVFGGAPPKNQTASASTGGATSQGGDDKIPPAPVVSAAKQAIHSSYSTNAYMVLYRLIDPSRNMKTVTSENIPETHLSWIQAENIEFDRLRAEHQKRLDNVALTVYYDRSLLPDGGAEEEAKQKAASSANPHPSATDHMSTLTVNVDKHETLEKALSMVYEAGITRGLRLSSLKCIRLRPFAPQTGTKAPSWLPSSSQSTLEQLNFHHQKNVYLEVKPAAEVEWEDEEVFYTLGVIKYIPSPSSSSSIEKDASSQVESSVSSSSVNAPGGSFQPAVSLRVPWRATLSDLKTMIYQNDLLHPESISLIKDAYSGVETEKDQESFASIPSLPSGLLLRVFVVDSSANCKELKGEDGVLNEMHQLNDGQCVHIEYVPVPPVPLSLVNAKFDEERHKVQIFYNMFDSSNFDHSILIDTRKTLKQLKAEIAEVLGVSPMEFKMCRNLLSKEFNNLELSLSAANLYEGSAVCIVRGRPLGVNQIKIKVSIFKGSVDDEETFSNPWTVTVEETGLVDELRQVIASSPEFDEHLVSSGKFADIQQAAKSTKHFRLREKKANRCSSVLFNGDTLKEAMENLMDGDEVVVQILDSEDSLLKSQLILVFRRWIPSARQLASSSFELIVPRSATMATVKILLSEHLAIQATLPSEVEASQTSQTSQVSKEIPVKHLGVSKPYLFMIKKKDANALSGLNWELAEDVQLTQSPWYLGDGALLLFKDMRDPEHGPVEASSASSSRTGQTARREQQLKIHTIYDDPLPSSNDDDAPQATNNQPAQDQTQTPSGN
jgi:hypothetical protein